MRVALFGGSFHPPTKGHLQVARGVLKSGFVDEVWFVPTNRHPFADSQEKKSNMISFSLRVEMVEALIKDIDGLKVSLIEEHIGGRTWETVEALQGSFDHTFFWVIGSDCVKELPKWCKVPWLLENITFIVYPRRDSPLSTADVVLLKDHIIIEAEESPFEDMSSTKAREDPDGGFMTPEVRDLWKLAAEE